MNKDLVQRLTDGLAPGRYADTKLIAEARPALAAQVAVPFNPSAECSPTATQCPRCNNPHNACDRALAAPVANGWLKEAERLLQRFRLAECCAAIMVGQIWDGFDYVADATAEYETLLTHLRTHPAFVVPKGFALMPIEPTEAMWAEGRGPIMYRDSKHFRPESFAVPAWQKSPDGKVETDRSKGTTAVHVWRAMIAAFQNVSGK